MRFTVIHSAKILLIVGAFLNCDLALAQQKSPFQSNYNEAEAGEPLPGRIDKEICADRIQDVLDDDNIEFLNLCRGEKCIGMTDDMDLVNEMGRVMSKLEERIISSFPPRFERGYLASISANTDSKICEAPFHIVQEIFISNDEYITDYSCSALNYEIYSDYFYQDADQDKSYKQICRDIGSKLRLPFAPVVFTLLDPPAGVETVGPDTGDLFQPVTMSSVEKAIGLKSVYEGDLDAFLKEHVPGSYGVAYVGLPLSIQWPYVDVEAE